MSSEGHVITCKAAVLWKLNEPLCIEDVQVAVPKNNEVRVKMIATGICHSDVSFCNGTIPVICPVIVGHEGAGIVESIGPNVTKFKPGDHVVPLFMPYCGDCKYCKVPGTNHCVLYDKIIPKSCMTDGSYPITCKGQNIGQLCGISTFSEYSVCPEESLVKVNEKAPLEKICLIGCAIPTGYGSAINTAKVKPGSTCAIWGLGPVGLATVMGCKAAGAKRIIGIDTNPSKFEFGKTFGCTEFINPKELEKPITDHLKDICDGDGADFTFECIGNVNAIRDALESTAPMWGVSVIIGLAPFKEEVKFRPLEITRGRTWTGSLYGGYKSIDVTHLVEDYLNKKIMIDELITHKLKLDEINKGFDLLLQGKSLRSVIEF